ncbi:DUF4249 domain-containing protein [Emticicia sp. SJ17W-69]|uniref:DUF4249 domain-containing protein n=1 Tax=Emticicia sp. SJ17W-69 TaxID=3421657 RepID=UPI003EB853D8
MKNKRIILSIIALGAWICSCVEPFDLNVNSQLRLLTVDATLSDIANEQSITITESANIEELVYTIPVLNAKVELLVNGTEKISFIEKGAGVYNLPLDFKLKAGSIYKLIFSKADGTKYESGEEKLVVVPEIIKVHDEFKLDGVAKGNSFDPANYVYLDIKDPANDQNNYYWTWQLWEKQDVCISCEGGRYFELPPPGQCKVEPQHSGSVFDYYCKGDCWEIFYNEDLNVFNDIYSNGTTVNNKLIAKIPYYSPNGSLIEIKQQSISLAAYRYLKLIADQVQNTGSLVDTPPAAIVGNVKNIANPKEAVVGFFMVTSIRSVRYWIDRKEPIEKKILPVGLRNHPNRQEPPTGALETGRPPLVPCIASAKRTPIKPNGWVN